jgi:myo-inositol-1(or 4)-monophosphatase
MTTALQPDLDQLLNCAISSAHAAGNHALKNNQRRNDTTHVAQHDVKLVLDAECQEKALSVIHSTFPDHAVLAEEPDSSPERPEDNYEWVVDPIDGTVNFFHGLPYWCSSIAVRRDGDVLAAAVFAPELGRLYTAASDRSSTCNDKPIAVSGTDSLDGSLICSGMDGYSTPDHAPYSILTRVASNVQKARILGSAALDICQVACGAADGYYEQRVFEWDVAAAGLIVRQAGGQTDIPNGPDDTHCLSFIATNGLIHAALRDLIAKG